jgi:hypothetical protein
VPDFDVTQKVISVDGKAGLALDKNRKKVCLIERTDGQKVLRRVFKYADVVSSEIMGRASLGERVVAGLSHQEARRTYDVDAYLSQFPQLVYWRINRYANEINEGDRASIWRSGANHDRNTSRPAPTLLQQRAPIATAK